LVALADWGQHHLEATRALESDERGVDGIRRRGSANLDRPSQCGDAKGAIGRLPKVVVEDAQALTGVRDLRLAGQFGQTPVGLAPGGDPPDRVLSVGDKTFGLELTAFTLEDLRGRLARVRLVERALSELLLGGARWAHLSGRVVHISDVESPFSGNADEAAVEIAETLLEDKGFQGQDVDPEDGFPEVWVSDRGFYGKVADFTVNVMAGPVGSPVEVVAASQANLLVSDVQELLASRIAEKDRAGNDILLMTTGLVDSAGYVCPADMWLFQMVVALDLLTAVRADYLQQVVLHDWATGRVEVAHM
jgi:hypothetical protein